MSDPWIRRAVVGCLGVVAVGASFLSPAARAEVPRPVYVALGDSYTSAPLISKPVGTWGGDNGWDNPENPYTCGKSDRNYPHLVARHLGLYDPDDVLAEAGEHPEHPGFIDISCGSARTKHMTEPQTGLPGGGYNPAQFDAFDRVAEDEVVTLVTVGIGGNDIGFGDLSDRCVQPPEAVGGTPCRVHYENEGGVGDSSIDGDIMRHRLAKLRISLAAVLAGIHERAPEAQVLVFGYPALLPEYVDGCYPYIPILPTDAEYLRGVQKDLNRAIRETAETASDGERHYAHYVDWYSPSIGHDMCQPPGVAWVNGIVVAPPSYPVHPNLLGTQGAANAAVGVLERIGFAFTATGP